MTKDTPETHPIGCVGKDGSAESANYLRSLELFTANEEEDIRKQWTAAEDWSDFLQLNRAFLSGEAKLSCYHLGPIIPETEPLVPGLLRLHDYGLLTHESQPSETKGPFTDTCPCCDDESYVETHQRPFLSFIMPYDCEAIPQECVRRFLVELMTDEGPYVSILNFDGNCRFGRCRTKLRVACNFPDDWSTHIERVVRNDLAHSRLLVVGGRTVGLTVNAGID